MGSKTLQRLMEYAPRGQPLDHEMLRDIGVSPRITSYMVDAGWLQRLSYGAYLLTGDSPSRDGIIAFLSRRIPGLHVGGKTALDWHGGRQTYAGSQRVVLWGLKPYSFPDWVDAHIGFSYQTTRLFGEPILSEKGLKPLPGGNPHVLVSVPERALLELASDIGKGQSMDEAAKLTAMLDSIRPNVLDDLMSQCTRVKVVKLVRDLGHKSGFAWGTDLQKHVDRLGPGKRWSNKTRDGERLTLKP
ncbi:type IV toxin-antitoxin system AbiEi family antitoxin domain-containing protein [Ralstonia pseudosolanacearum]|uniref:type IV toxin-antitoxin system AbiEi family antitoxin domain-containing protein n=1 Tax=Ralstonia pseudosolanacearum TaxID=1310165 RepID=UPI003CFA3C52